MSFQSIAVTVLMSVSGLLGVKPVATDTMKQWQVTQDWHSIPASAGSDVSFMNFEAESTAIPELCQNRPNDYVSFPAIIHGSHVISIDGHVIQQFGDPTFNTMRSFYGAPVLSCKDLQGGKVLKWAAYSYTQYFARISFWPTLSEDRPLYNVFSETFHIIGAGAGILIAIFAFTMFGGKMTRGTTLSVTLSSFFSSLYLGGCVAGFMGLPWSMLTAHKVADIGVWFAIVLLLNALRLENLVSKKVFWTYFGSVVIAIAMILIGSTGDEVQLGTTIPFSFTLGVWTYTMIKLGRSLLNGTRTRVQILQFFSLGSFVAAVFNEMFAVTGLIHSSPMLPFGFMSGVMFLTLAVNERINEAYRERDYLRGNLENEVERKTAELNNKTKLLEDAMGNLKNTQAELVQSAKLASLGTLSAGIAHEINNSLNYVNGALQPLEKLIEKTAQPQDKEKINKLVGVMKEGLNLTLEIIKSLRTYTGLNQAKFNDVNLKKVVNSSLAILRNRMRGKINVEILVPDELTVFGSVVGLNQMFMNLISNAVDAMADGGTLAISSKIVDENIHLSIKDSGKGIPANMIDRIFEPFFTTKEVGSGTGLGLHIVKQEIERHHGHMTVQSEVGAGTTFHIVLPIKGAEEVSQQTPSLQAVRKAA